MGPRGDPRFVAPVGDLPGGRESGSAGVPPTIGPLRWLPTALPEKGADSEVEDPPVTTDEVIAAAVGADDPHDRLGQGLADPVPWKPASPKPNTPPSAPTSQ